MRKNKLYRMKKDCSNPDNKKMICEEIFKVNNTLKKSIRKQRDKFRKEQITEIEDLHNRWIVARTLSDVIRDVSFPETMLFANS